MQRGTVFEFFGAACKTALDHRGDDRGSKNNIQGREALGSDQARAEKDGPFSAWGIDSEGYITGASFVVDSGLLARLAL